MSTGPQQFTELISLEQWCALGEDASGRSELQEGVLIVSPKSRPAHQDAMFALAVQLAPQVPAGLRVSLDVDVVLDPATPATVRAPDLVVRRDVPAPLLHAADVLVAVEILSPGTRGTDLVMKRHEYAAAGIEHYWIVDVDAESIEVLILQDGAYSGAVRTGRVHVAAPFDLQVDLTALR